MKIKYFLSFAMTVYSTFAFARTSDMQCYLRLNNDMENAIAITDNYLSPDGSITITEADASMARPELSIYGFKVVVKDNIIKSMRIENKKETVVAERKDSFQVQYAQISLQSKKSLLSLECYLNPF